MIDSLSFKAANSISNGLIVMLFLKNVDKLCECAGLFGISEPSDKAGQLQSLGSAVLVSVRLGRQTVVAHILAPGPLELLAKMGQLQLLAAGDHVLAVPHDQKDVSQGIVLSSHRGPLVL
jgi:hypothetical protein